MQVYKITDKKIRCMCDKNFNQIKYILHIKLW